MRISLGLLIVLCSMSVCRADTIKMSTGSGGDVITSRLYSVDYSCDVKSNSLGLVENALGRIAANTSKGTLAHNITIYQQSAAAAPGTAFAQSDMVFGTNVLVQDFVPFLHSTGQSVFSGCEGQFFINGSSNFFIEANVTLSSTNVVADLIAKGATVLKSAVSMGYALFRGTQPPEFAQNVATTGQLLTDYAAFKALLEAGASFKAVKTGKLRIGVTTITTFDAGGNVTSSVTFRVRPVVSLVADGNTKFIAAYNASATNQAIDLSSVLFGDLAKTCEQETQKYYNSGINDARDIAYLLYRRFLLIYNDHQNIAQCMGGKVATAALIIMRQLPTLSDSYKITQHDVDNILTAKPSDQPHSRPTLAKDVDKIVDMVARDAQTEGGLRGNQLVELKAHLSSSVVVEDATAGYGVLKLLFGDSTDDRKTVSVDDLRSALRRAGIQRWLAVQATKKDKDPTFPLYDPTIDSAVMVIAAKAGRAESLDYNKSVMFGVHLLFAKALNQEPLVVTKIGFEDHLRDILIKENPTLFANVPGTTKDKTDTPDVKKTPAADLLETRHAMLELSRRTHATLR